MGTMGCLERNKVDRERDKGGKEFQTRSTRGCCALLRRRLGGRRLIQRAVSGGVSSGAAKRVCAGTMPVGELVAAAGQSAGSLTAQRAASSPTLLRDHLVATPADSPAAAAVEIRTCSSARGRRRHPRRLGLFREPLDWARASAQPRGRSTALGELLVRQQLSAPSIDPPLGRQRFRRDACATLLNQSCRPASDDGAQELCGAGRRCAGVGKMRRGSPDSRWGHVSLTAVSSAATGNHSAPRRLGITAIATGVV